MPFYMYDDPALDHGWLRHCANFPSMRASAYNERLAEVYVRDALAIHPWRTSDPSAASLVYVPLWEVVSFNVGECNGTTHAQRMARAAAALRSAPAIFARQSQLEPEATGRRQIRFGFDHLFVSSGCIEQGTRLEARLTRRLAGLLRASIVGRDRAYSPFYAASAVGRCTIEVPYVANPFAHAAHVKRHRDAGGAASSSRQLSSSAALRSGDGGGGRRHWLLSFMGSLDVCCDPGKSIRHAMHRLVDLPANESVQVMHFARINGRPLPGRTPAEQLERYRAAGEQMATSKFCLIPAGDNEVSSRLYSAMSAGCIPVVVANQLSGAFASTVPYSRFWLRVEQSTFIHDPLALLPRLRAFSAAELSERRARMLRFVPDVTYNQSMSDATPAADLGTRHEGRFSSRLASNLLRAAHAGCLVGAATPHTGTYPRWHKYADDDHWGLNCSCTMRPPPFFLGPPDMSAAAARDRLWTRGRVPTEVCRCLHCATLCPVNDTVADAGATTRHRQQAKGFKPVTRGGKAMVSQAAGAARAASRGFPRPIKKPPSKAATPGRSRPATKSGGEASPGPRPKSGANKASAIENADANHGMPW